MKDTASLFADFFAFFLLTLHLEIMQYYRAKR